MGEYFDWVNADKREFISPHDFGLGNKIYESSQKDSPLIAALHVLLCGRWKGDRIVWLGDTSPINADTNCGVLKSLYEQSEIVGYDGMASDMVYEYYKDIAGRFKDAEKDVREEIEIYLNSRGDENPFRNKYGVDEANPYEGLFMTAGRIYRYTVNHTKRVYYSLDETRVYGENGEELLHTDPLPVLMCYGRGIEGEWLGDIIGASDELPQGYTLHERINIAR